MAAAESAGAGAAAKDVSTTAGEEVMRKMTEEEGEKNGVNKDGEERKEEKGGEGEGGKEGVDVEEVKKGGELLFCGCASWENVGRKIVDARNENVNLVTPTRLSTLLNVDIAFIASGSASSHCVALDVSGRCYTWGRNEKGQLGHGDLLQRNTPTLVTALTGHVLVKAGAGRSHTVVVTDYGASLAFGWNKHGQLGSGSFKEATNVEAEKLPVRCLVTDAKQVVCGAEFTIWLSTLPGSSILSAGCPQYGQLGHGTDHEYNAKEGSIRLVYAAQPRPRAIASLAGKNITKVACGNNHSVVVDSDGYVYTWGFGGYGRLGHKVQKDEWVPRVLDVFQRANTLPASAIVAAGATYSACTAGGGQLYMWGRVKPVGDNWMYPKPVLDLSGWNIRSMDSGNTSSFAAADASCISWGTAIYGELGYGPSGPKSSASPKLVDVLEGMHVISVACGIGHSLVVVDRSKLPEKLEKLEVYSGHEVPQPAVDVEDENPVKTTAKKRARDAKKRKAATLARAIGGAKKAKTKPVNRKKQALEKKNKSKDSEDTEDEQHKPVKGRGKGRVTGKGKGGLSGPPKSPPAKQTKVQEPPIKKRQGRSGKTQTESTPPVEVTTAKSSSPAAKRRRGRGSS